MEILVEYAVLVGVQEQNNEHFDYEMEELKNLAEAIDVHVVGTCDAKFGAQASSPLCR